MEIMFDMATSLPIKLKKEPLIDAIFEVRFSSKVPASVVVPGFLFTKLEGEKTIESLPISQLPKLVRDADPNLKFVPLSRIDWKLFFISIGDFSISVSCKHPYSGWASFKPAIVAVMKALEESNIVNAVERYSMKYVDMIPSSNNQQKVSMINFKVSIAGHELEKEPFQLRIEIPRDGLVHAVQVVSSAQATLHNGNVMEGLIVDVDSFSAQDGISMQSLLEGLEEKLEAIHSSNKAMFFDCISLETVESLEPIYE